MGNTDDGEQWCSCSGPHSVSDSSAVNILPFPVIFMEDRGEGGGVEA